VLDSLAYRTAKNRIHSFAGEGEEMVVRHDQAMECFDCRDFLQLGIDAYQWLTRADEQLREEVFAGQIDHNAEADQAIDVLYKTWLKPCDFAEKWITVQQQRNFEIENLTEFRRCVEEVRAIVRDNPHVGPQMAEKRDLAIAEFERGATVEWEIRK